MRQVHRCAFRPGCAGISFHRCLKACPLLTTEIGLDLSPVNVQDDDAVRYGYRHWCGRRMLHGPNACVRRFYIAQQQPPRLLAGDALTLLPDLLAGVSDEMALCVYHTFVVNQFSQDERDQLAALLAAASRQRTIYRVSIEWLRTDHPQLELHIYRDGVEAEHRLLARCEGHGRWLEWRGNNQ